MCNDGCFCCFWFLSVYTLQRNFIIAASLSLLPCDSTASLPWYATPGLYLTAHYICLLECATNSDFRYIYKSIASQVMGNYCHLWQHMHTCRPYVHSSLVSKCLRRAAYDLCAPVSATIARRCSFLSLYVLLHVATWWSRALGFHVIDRAALLTAVPQLGTLYQRPFAISPHHRHHHVSAAISKLNFFAEHMALTHRSTFVIACYKNGRT